MKKKSSIIVLIILAALTVLLGWTAIRGWGETGTLGMSNIRTGLDLSGGVSITYQTVEDAPSQTDMNDTIWKLQQRVQVYSTEAQVYQQGLNRINIEIPGVTDANEILEDLGKPGSLIFTDSENNTVMEGTDVAAAAGVSRQNQTSGAREYVVELTLTPEGTAKFAEATTNNVGKSIYIIYDGNVVSAPTVREPITGGMCEISGMESLESAQNLAAFIRIGSLSLELEEIYSNVVGAQLGQDALSSSVLAGLIGILIIIVIMIIVYRVSGIAAGWALIFFTFLDLIIMNAFDVTLTLTGIAGVILTIGMAVDANVIIYARMREELNAGRSIHGSIQAGFKKAFSAILDGNITTLIAALFLYILGTGSIRGFAVTLAIGIVLSMFSALVISRIISYALYGAGIKSLKAYGTIKERKPFNFVGRKIIFIVIALILVITIPIGMVINKNSQGNVLNFGLDFIGGTATTVDFGENMSLQDLDQQVEPVVSGITGDANIQFQKVTSSTQVIIKTRELSVSEREALDAALAENFEKVDIEEITAENISSVISGEMRNNAILAVVLAIIFMLVYIAIRFRDLRFATSSVCALIHDVLIVLAFYVWFRFSVGNSFIAVMLTILGYSINATIVIFDRIRENLKAMNGQSLKLIVNTSITQTLTRSIYSSLTTFVTIFVLFLLGVPSIKEFALPIIVGIIAGGYSSVFLAGNFWYLMKVNIGKNRMQFREKPEAPAVEMKDAQGAAEDIAAAGKEAAGSAVKDAAAKAGKHVKKDRSLLQSTKPKKGGKRK